MAVSCYNKNLNMSGMMISTHFLEVNMNQEKIRQKLMPIIEPFALSIYSMKTKREFGEQILEILLDGPKIDSDMLESIHLKLYDTLTDEDIDPNYFLELSSVGIERPIESDLDMLNAIGKYVYLESPKYKGNGTLIAINDDILLLEINEKGKIRKIEIGKVNVKHMRYAVKF
jgi:ribosome maturation factor RimP